MHPAKQTSRLNSFKAALNGLMVTFSKEMNFQIEIIVAICVCVLAAWLNFSIIDWLILVMTIFGVLSLELINTGFEHLADIRMPTISPAVKIAKDISAAAVLVGCVGALIIGIILFLPRIWQLFAILY